MKRNIFIALAISIFFGSEAFSEDQISKIEETYRSTQTLSAEFIQETYVTLTEKTIRRNGRLFYQRGGKLRIEYAGAKMTHYISDGKTLWIKDTKSGEMQTYALKNSGLPDEALKFLTELGNLRKYFTASKTKPAETVATWKLVPKKKSTYRHLLCIFDDTFYLKNLAIYSHSGNKSEYKFFNRKVDEKFSEKLFLP